MTKQELVAQIRKKGSFLCVGLDTDIEKIPSFLLDREDPIFEFNKMIIDATKDYCVAYKPNIAFYESMGVAGWQSLEKTLAYIPSDIFTISDAKRGDIGNTSKMYAKAFFQNMDFDSVTVAPYMGEDSVRPFTDFANKWVILLGLTSNVGSADFQKEKLVEEDQYLYEKVLKKSQEWGTPENMMYVIGATHGKTFESIREIVPNHFLLVPGVGAQGGSLADVANYGLNAECGLLVNSSRGIIYADQSENFARVAQEKAQEMQQEMQQILKKAGII